MARACHLSPPARHARAGAVDPSDYAYPQCFKYPVDTPEHTRAAASYFARFKRNVPASERRKVAARIEAAKKKFGIGEYRETNPLDEELLPTLVCVVYLFIPKLRIIVEARRIKVMPEEALSNFDRVGIEAMVHPEALSEFPWEPQFEVDAKRNGSGLTITVDTPSAEHEEFLSEEGRSGLIVQRTPAAQLNMDGRGAGEDRGLTEIPFGTEEADWDPTAVVRSTNDIVRYRFFSSHNESIEQKRAQARAELGDTPPDQLTDRQMRFALQAGNDVLFALASDPRTQPKHLDWLAHSGWMPVLRRLARNPQTPLPTLYRLARDAFFPAIVARNPAIELELMANPHLPRTVPIALAMAFQDDHALDQED